MKTIMVFGATGNLGTYFVDHLHDLGYTIWAIGRRNVNEGYYKQKGINCASVDVTNKQDFEKLPKSGIDAVVHISGAMPSRMKGYNPQSYIDVNVSGTLNVLEYCRQAGVSSYLYTHSHSDVAGYWNTGELIKADAPRKLNLKGDHAIYIISKNAGVDLVQHYNQEYGLRTFIFRLPTVYNYRPINEMYVNGEVAPIGYRLFMEKAMRSEPLEIWGDPKSKKDIVYIKDFNQLLTKAIESDRKSGFYNVATGVSVTLEEQIKGVVKVFSPENNPSDLIYCPEKPSQNSYLYDISNAREELGYEPQYDYIQMLEDMKKEMEGDRFEHLKNSNVVIS